MKILVKIALATDGDFSVVHPKNYHLSNDIYSDYYGAYIFDDSDKTTLYRYEDGSYLQFDCWWRACRLLEHMLTDLHVIFTHHYVLDYLYHMFDESIQSIGKREKYHYASIGGNYEGTHIEVTVLED